MITGDHPRTARAIARRLGLLGRRLPVRDPVRRRPRRARRRRAPRPHRRRLGVRAHQPGAEAPHRRRVEGDRRHRRHDRRRRERRPRPPASRHRRRHGHHRHRRQQGSGRHGAGGRQLRHHRPRRRGGPADLRQHPPLRALPADHQLRRDLGDVPRPVLRTATPAPAHPDPLDQPGHRRRPRRRPRARTRRARQHAAPPTAARRSRSSPAGSGSTRCGSGSSWPRWCSRCRP